MDVRTTSFFCVLAAAVIAGCGEGVQRQSAGRQISLAEFAQPDLEGAVVDASPGVTGTAAGDDVDDTLPEDDFTDYETVDIEFIERPVLRVAKTGERVVVDSLVGEVNGKPIFADGFFEPIEDRLLRAADESRGPQLEAAFRRIINSWLREIVLDALILAEAEASLSKQEKMGLIAFLRQIQEEEIRLGGGTRSGAEDRHAASGDDLDQYLGRQKDMILLSQVRMKKIEPRVIVSWRDIENEYKRRYDEFNPPARVELSMIRLRTTSQTELIVEVTGRLKDGEPFADVAEELGFADGGHWQTFVFGKGGISDINVSEEMREALKGMKEGDTTAPFQVASVTVWLHVAKVDQPTSYSIYDPKVQRILKNAIRMRRSQEEWNRYIESLLERGIYNELDQMAERLYEIGIQRYAP